MTEQEEGKRGLTIYEVGYLILPSIPEDKLAGVAESIKEIVAKEGGMEIDGEAPFKQPLAYSMSKTIGSSRYVVSEAYLGWIKFDLPAGKAGVEHPIEVVKKGIEKMEEILRFLIVKASRQTDFTFAKARADLKEMEEKVEEEKGEAETSGHVVEQEVI